MSDADEDTDAEQFLETTFSSACSQLGLHQAGRDGIFTRFKSRNGPVLLAYATSLGSVLSVMVSLAGTDIVRSILLSPEESTSVEFVTTHLISYILNGGNYDRANAPHLQGLSSHLVERLLPYLDAQSRSNLRQTSWNFHNMVRCDTTGAPRIMVPPPNSSLNRFVWQQLDII